MELHTPALLGGDKGQSPRRIINKDKSATVISFFFVLSQPVAEHLLFQAGGFRLPKPRSHFACSSSPK